MSSDTEVQASTEANMSEGVVSAATEAAPSVTEGPSLEDKAAYDYKNLIPQFYEKIEFMPKKHLLRVFKALVEYPLENSKPSFSYENERKAFYLGMQLFDCKFVLMRAVLQLVNDKAALAKFQAELETTEGNGNDLQG